MYKFNENLLTERQREALSNSVHKYVIARRYEHRIREVKFGRLDKVHIYDFDLHTGRHKNQFPIITLTKRRIDSGRVIYLSSCLNYEHLNDGIHVGLNFDERNNATCYYLLRKFAELECISIHDILKSYHIQKDCTELFHMNILNKIAAACDCKVRSVNGVVHTKCNRIDVESILNTYKSLKYDVSLKRTNDDKKTFLDTVNDIEKVLTGMMLETQCSNNGIKTISVCGIPTKVPCSIPKSINKVDIPMDDTVTVNDLKGKFTIDNTDSKSVADIDYYKAYRSSITILTNKEF